MENKKQPPKYKTAIMIWIAIYPTINLIFYVFGDVLNTFVLPLRTLILTLILVPLMVYVLLPFAGRILKGWLHS